MSDILERLGWVLIHSLWEDTALGLVALVGCLFLKSSSASSRYNFLCGCLFLCGIAPILTWFWLGTLDWELQTKLVPFSLQAVHSAPASAIESGNLGGADALYRKFSGPALNYIRLNWLLHQWLRIAATSWCGFVAYLFFRTFRDYRALSRLIDSGRSISRAQNVQKRYMTRVAVLARQMGIHRAISLMESAIIDVPSVVGWFKPVVFVPVSFLSSMPPDQIEAILAHELAHVRRYDNLVNLIQIGIETFLFYHFAVRWISRTIREERENCCDDIAIAIAGDKLAYVSALATLAERNLIPSPAAMAADGGSLVKRVERVFGVRQSEEMWSTRLARQAFVGMLVGVLMLGLCFGATFTVEHASVTKHVDKVYLTKELVSAAAAGNTSEMQSLIQQGADVNLNVLPTAENALFAAAMHNHVPAVQLLLQNGALINAKSDWGMSAIDWALTTGCFPMAKLLHDNGAEVSRGAWAAATDDALQLKAICSQGALSQGQKDDLMKNAVAMGHLDAVQFLEKMTGKPVDGKFLTAAASAENIPMMAYILRQGANIRTDGAAAMAQIVFFYDRPAAAKFLLQRGADPNQYTAYWGRYLLTEARSAEMVKVLLGAGANPNCEDEWGTALSAAPDAESVRLLVRAGANLHPVLTSGLSLIESVVVHDRYDKPDVLEELIRQGAAFDPRGNGVGALALAAAWNKVKMMESLLNLGVSPNAFLKAPFWQTSMIRGAVMGSSIDAVKLLLEQGGAVSGDPRDGGTPSSLALLSGDQDMAILLREGGAQDLAGLFLAVASGNAAEVNYLIANGTDVNKVDQMGHTPLFYALRNREVEIVKILVQHGAVVRSGEFSQGNQ